MIDYESRCRSYHHHKFSAIKAGLRDDIVRFATFSPEYRPEVTFRTGVSIFFKPAILCLFLYRIAHYLYLCRWKRLARFVSALNLTLHKAYIPPQSCIGPGCFIGHPAGTTFLGTAGRGLTLLSLAICCPREDAFGAPASQAPRLGDNVLIGAHAVVIGPVNVGDDVKVATNTWLSVDCPPNRIACSAKIRQRVRPIGESEQQRAVANASDQ